MQPVLGQAGDDLADRSTSPPRGVLAHAAPRPCCSCRRPCGELPEVPWGRSALSVVGVRAEHRGMSSTASLLLPAGEPASRPDPLRLAAAACLARFTRASRVHTESDLRIYLAWCAERSVDPLAVERAQVEL